MKKILLGFLLFTISLTESQAQNNLPHRMTADEQQLMPAYLQSRVNALAVNPPASPVRTMAEWEELQGVLIGWKQFSSMLTEIVREAKKECMVYILTNNRISVYNTLNNAGIDTLTNITFVDIPFNSVWSRDYGPWSAYTNDVDSLLTIDWIYNRPRPDDDNVPVTIASLINTPLYQTTSAPYDLIHTGGNFMCDGFGTGFSSNLIVNENPNHTIAEIDTIMKKYMGISRYIKMPVLPYDAIHHIDMHMKLLNEETLLMGQYPQGIADGPQIEANLLYVTSNFNSVFGTPYKIIRIPMPADNGAYPNTTGDYLTYTNSSFINNTVIVPTYNIPDDTTALRIYRDALPGYHIVGINSNASIGSLGALHCITKDIGTDDPLLISHQQLNDTYDSVNPYTVTAYIKHRSGIQNATLFYRTDTLMPYSSTTLVPVSGQNDYFSGLIPAYPAGTRVYYYIHAESVSGKQQSRPMPAPVAYFTFKVLGTTGINELNSPSLSAEPVFPNPANAITCIPLNVAQLQNVNITLHDITGKLVKTIFEGTLNEGHQFKFFDASQFAKGAYMLMIQSDSGVISQKIMVR
ncbi:MAG: agmatine deiminase family protein [Bacteroidetes bacterium]|nr:agmatine deiminase family protein [Bacteroidota bacterium]